MDERKITDPQTSYEYFKVELLGLVRGTFPIRSLYGDTAEIQAGWLGLGDPRQPERECRQYKDTYRAPLIILTDLIINATGEVKEQEIFLGDFPLMTPQGAFILKGAEHKPKPEVGEIFAEEIRKGLSMMALTTRARLTRIDPERASPSSLISIRPVMGAINRALKRSLQ